MRRCTNLFVTSLTSGQARGPAGSRFANLSHSYHARKVRTTLVVPGHVNTPLFSRVSFPRSFLWHFVFPSVAPHSIVKAVIAAVDEQESRTINLPFYVNFAWWAGAFPSWARDFAQWVRSLHFFVLLFRTNEASCQAVRSGLRHARLRQSLRTTERRGQSGSCGQWPSERRERLTIPLTIVCAGSQSHPYATSSYIHI